MLETWKKRVRQIRVETYTLYLAYRDPRVPVYAKIFTACVVGYAFSPIDLIPDFIPVVGYLDDLILVPLGIFLALRMIPEAVLVEKREEALKILSGKRPRNWVAAAVILSIWSIVIVWGAIGVLRFFGSV